MFNGDYQVVKTKKPFFEGLRSFFFNKITVFVLGVLVFLVVVGGVLFVLSQKSKFTKNKLLPGGCLVLQEKYCPKVKLINDPWMEGGLLAAYKVPKGSVLFSPVEGSYSNTPTFYFEKDDGSIVQYPGVLIEVEENGISEKTIYSFIYFREEKSEVLPNLVVKKGDALGLVSDKNIDFLGDYNVIFSVVKQRLQDGRYVSESENQELKKILNIR